MANRQIPFAETYGNCNEGGTANSTSSSLTGMKTFFILSNKKLIGG